MEAIVAKGQQRSNREIRKPKKDAASKSKPGAATVQSVFAQPAGKFGGKKK
jgi:hypothetical protein